MDGASAAIGGYRYTFIEAPVLQLLSSGEQKTLRQLPTVQEEGTNPRSYSRYDSTNTHRHVVIATGSLTHILLPVQCSVSIECMDVHMVCRGYMYVIGLVICCIIILRWNFFYVH